MCPPPNGGFKSTTPFTARPLTNRLYKRSLQNLPPSLLWTLKSNENKTAGLAFSPNSYLHSSLGAIERLSALTLPYLPPVPWRIGKHFFSNAFGFVAYLFFLWFNIQKSIRDEPHKHTWKPDARYCWPCLCMCFGFIIQRLYNYTQLVPGGRFPPIYLSWCAFIMGVLVDHRAWGGFVLLYVFATTKKNALDRFGCSSLATFSTPAASRARTLTASLARGRSVSPLPRPGKVAFM